MTIEQTTHPEPPHITVAGHLDKANRLSTLDPRQIDAQLVYVNAPYADDVPVARLTVPLGEGHAEALDFTYPADVRTLIRRLMAVEDALRTAGGPTG